MLTEDMMNGAVVMILICCTVASIMTERAAKQVRMELTSRELEHEEIGEAEFARQVVSVSNPLTAEGLMRMAISMRSRMNKLPVTLLFVRNGIDRNATRAMGRTAIENASNVAEIMDVETHAVERFDMNVSSAISNVAVEQEATEIVIGFHRKANIVDSFFGSMIDQLLESSNRMLIMSRCFIPVDTVTRIKVVVPEKAEYETGFHLWVSRVATLAANIEARITFVSYKPTEDLIRTAITEDKIEADFRFETLSSYDDFILLSGDVGDDDLLVVVGARRGSISWNSELEQLPAFLSRYFSRHNLLMIYPRQF